MNNRKYQLASGYIYVECGWNEVVESKAEKQAGGDEAESVGFLVNLIFARSIRFATVSWFLGIDNSRITIVLTLLMKKYSFKYSWKPDSNTRRERSQK